MSHSASSVRTPALVLGAVGVVYGDIGTSPLYAFRESLAAASGHGGAIETAMVLGVLSLILWSLFVVVTVKYVALLLRADNNGEGGILSLMALTQRAIGRQPWVLFLGIMGVALFYGDSVITPAISVLSAVEGTKLITPVFKPYVVPMAMAIIIALFVIQQYGTEKVSRFFGPIMALWFASLAWGGLRHIADDAQVLQALNPAYALGFLMEHGFASLIVLGSVFLAVTGGEALYADLGHFGRRPIRIAWGGFVLPALVLNYFGQAALVLSHPEAASQSFFLLYPEEALIPMVILAMLATVIASQAVITGAFSLTHQAIQLGLLPRQVVQFTSKDQKGQIYLPRANWLLLAGVLFLIAMFRSSGSLAAAYGIAVTGAMAIDSLLMLVLARKIWRWNHLALGAIILPLIIIDLVFFSANLTKFFEGGFLPVLFSLALTTIMFTWVRGSRILHEAERGPRNTIESVLRELRAHPPRRVEGTAIYLSSNPNFAPSALTQNLKHNRILHEQNLIINLRFDPSPYIDNNQRLAVEKISDDFTRVTMRFGYMEPPNVSQGVRLLCARHGLDLDPMSTSYFISRRHIMPSAHFGMPLWQDKIYISLANNAANAADYFHIPLSRVVELGVQMNV